MRQTQQRGRKEGSSDEPLRPLLTIADVCKLLHLSRPMIYTLIDQGLPFMKFGKAVRFSPTSLERWLARREEIA
jgi:excisionase family DNA binding protein